MITVEALMGPLNAQVLSGTDLLVPVTSGFVGDLLSVVMGKAKAGCAWMTIQSHLNIIAVATLVDVACVIVTEGYDVDENATEKAKEEGIILLSTKLSSYEAACALAHLGIC